MLVIQEVAQSYDQSMLYSISINLFAQNQSRYLLGEGDLDLRLSLLSCSYEGSLLRLSFDSLLSRGERSSLLLSSRSRGSSDLCLDLLLSRLPCFAARLASLSFRLSSFFARFSSFSMCFKAFLSTFAWIRASSKAACSSSVSGGGVGSLGAGAKPLL